MINCETVRTGDGSYTLLARDLGEHYHSHFGAVTESEHVFIRSGLLEVAGSEKDIRLLEVGFGTGLNALLSWQAAVSQGLDINYTSIEPNPVQPQLAISLDYPAMLTARGAERVFDDLHNSSWGATVKLPGGFSFIKIKTRLQDFVWAGAKFNLVFFDAFSPDVQPEMWTLEIFQKVAAMMEKGGVLVTYSCKGSVKRALSRAGFRHEKLPGPPGKREILRAVLASSTDVKSP